MLNRRFPMSLHVRSATPPTTSGRHPCPASRGHEIVAQPAAPFDAYSEHAFVRRSLPLRTVVLGLTRRIRSPIRRLQDGRARLTDLDGISQRKAQTTLRTVHAIG